MGKTFLGIHRKTFILGRDREVLAVLEDLKPQEHASAALKFIQAQRSAGGKCSVNL